MVEPGTGASQYPHQMGKERPGKRAVYAGYIARLSMRELYDEYGNPHLCVDEELRRRLETKLITKLLTFRVR